MLRPLSELQHFQIEATNGIIGHLVGAYFDDERWTVRYVVVNTDSWFHAREVLISPAVLGATDSQARTLVVHLSTKQIEEGPSIDVDKPVFLQPELGGDGRWPAYGNMGLWDSCIPSMAARQANANESAPARKDGDPHLRSSREVIGYHLHAIDDTLGHVDDFIIDDKTWTIRYLAVDTSNWWFGGHVLIAPQWIRAVRWPERMVDLAVTRDVIKHSPTWTPSFPITQDYEDRLLDYYRLRQAWSVDRRSNEAPLEPNPPRS